MSRVLLFGSILCLSALPGCGGPEKELPKDVGVPTDRGKDVETAAPVPTASHPDAVKFVAKCLAAATDGHPDRIERAKVNKQNVKGRWKWHTGQVVDASREYQGVWPDRARVAYDFSAGEIKKFLFLFHRPTLQAFADDGAGPKALPGSKETAESARVDAIGEHWLPMLVPLSDPKTIVFGLKKEPFGTKVADTIKVAIPDCPLFTMWFDEEGSSPGLVTYTHLESDSRIPKQVILSGHKRFSGLLLPTQLESRRNAVTVQEWTVIDWEFPDKIDDAVFDQPVKK